MVLEEYKKLKAFNCFGFFNLNITNKFIYQTPSKKHQLTIKDAVRPTNYFWENLHYSKKERSDFTLKYNLYSLGILCVSFLFIYLLTWLQKRESVNLIKKYGATNIYVKGFGIGISMIIAFINFFLSIYIRIFCQKEGAHTRTQFYINHAMKLGFVQFINTSVLNFFLQFLIFGNYYGAGFFFPFSF